MSHDQIKDNARAFLATDPYPSQPRDGWTAGSVSGVTDGTSDYGENPSTSSKAVQGSTGPAGEVGLPPSRPSTAVTNASTTRPHPSRRGLAAFSAARSNSMRTASSSDRPSTAASRTHVPSITAQGFQKPMSPVLLQSQRASRTPRPGSSLAQAVSPAIGEKPESRDRRYSDASVHTLRDRPRSPVEPPAPSAPASQRKTSDAAGSTSHLPLQPAQGSTARPAPKSPRSFRDSLGIGSKRNSRQDLERRPSPSQCEKLQSEPPSPKTLAQDARRKPAPGKNYQYFAGNLIFMAGGRLLNTRARPLNVVTFLLTALPSGLFFGFSAPWLWHNVSPALPIIYAYVCFLALSSFLHAALSDPGILPRNIHPHAPDPEDADPLDIGPPTTEWVMVRTFPSKRTHKAVDQDSAEAARPPATAMEVPTKYCKSCSIWRPPRAHHCRVCDACIETQDHHCVWINNCVGRRNYRYFFGYVSSASVLAILLLAFSVTHVAQYASLNGLSFGSALAARSQERVAFAMLIYSLLALPYPASLFGYHIFLTCRGETTREYLNSHKFLPKDRHRPFSQSTWLQNFLAVALRPKAPTYMRFKARYEPGDVRFGHTQTKKERRQDLKERYTTSSEPEKHEMKDLSLQPPPTASSVGKPRTLGGVSNPINSTPRL